MNEHGARPTAQGFRKGSSSQIDLITGLECNQNLQSVEIALAI